jgi:ribosomal protein S10
MKTLNLLISSKSNKSLNNFLNVFNKNLLIVRSTFVKKTFKKRLKKTVITILKSPHVNKNAQEQFEIKYLTRQLLVSTADSKKFLIFIKKLKTFLFPDIYIKIKLFTNKKKSNLNNRNLFNIDNYYSNLVGVHILNRIQNNLAGNKKILLNNINKKLIIVNSPKILKFFDAYGKF